MSGASVTTSNAPQGDARKGPVVLALAVFVVAAFLLRAWALYARGILDYDEVYYYILGQNLVGQRGYLLNGLPHTAFPPLYPLLVGLAGLVTSNVRVATSLVSALAGAFLTVPVFFLARNICGERIGRIAALASALWPTLAFFAARCVPYRLRMYAGSEPLFLTFFACAVLFLWLSARRGKMRHALLAGVAFGLAALVRNEALLLLVFLLLWFLADSLFSRAVTRIRAMTNIALVVMAFLLTVSPFAFYVHSVSGQWSLGSKLSNFTRVRPALHSWIQRDDGSEYLRLHYALNSDATRMLDDYWGVYGPNGDTAPAGPSSSAIALVSNPDWRWLSPFMRSFAFGDVPLIPSFAWIVLILGVLPPFNSPALRRYFLLLLTVFAALALQAVAVYSLPRFQLPLVLLAVIPFARGVNSIAAIAAFAVGVVAGRFHAQKAAGILAVALVLFALAADAVYENLLGNRRLSAPAAISSTEADADFARALADLLPPGSTLMCNKPWIAVLAGLDWRVSPADTPERLLTYAQSAGIDYALLGAWQGGRPEPLSPLTPYLAQELTAGGEVLYLYDFTAGRKQPPAAVPPSLSVETPA